MSNPIDSINGINKSLGSFKTGNIDAGENKIMKKFQSLFAGASASIHVDPKVSLFAQPSGTSASTGI